MADYGCMREFILRNGNFDTIIIDGRNEICIRVIYSDTPNSDGKSKLLQAQNCITRHVYQLAKIIIKKKAYRKIM